MSGRVSNFVGDRGERMAELALTLIGTESEPAFSVTFLGGKWETSDLLAVAEPTAGLRPYLFAQVKTTTGPLPAGRRGLGVTVPAEAVASLRRVPGPTFVFGVHEASQRVFARAVLRDGPPGGIYGIPAENELTPETVTVLRAETVSFWESVAGRKPTASRFR